MLFVSATKGLEHDSLLRISECLRDVLTTRFQPRIGVLSGPTFAREHRPWRTRRHRYLLERPDLARTIQQRFAGHPSAFIRTPTLSASRSERRLKNVIAIAAGVCAGLGLGANTMAALITRGLAEITDSP